MQAPLISILIPAFNAERWIAGTLQSALDQTWSRKEIVVVDDGSTDRTASVVGACGAPAVRLIRQPRRGGSAAQNEALRHATGDFIHFLDADDLLSPETLERQVNQIADRPGWVACGEWARFRTSPAEAAFERRNDWTERDPVEWLLRECTGGAPMLQPGRWLIPRAVAERAGLWDERLTLNNDFEYIVRVLLACEGVRFTPGARLYYRSGNPYSLASLRSDAAWRSAWLSLDLGTRWMLERADTARARRACADLFQTLAYDAYLEHPEIAAAAEQRAAALGGSPVPMGGGALFALLRTTLGWKQAKRVKKLAYDLGYSRVARAKEAALGRERWHTA
jgi:glycosyltransferase involved in cell wall biosynthesis